MNRRWIACVIVLLASSSASATQARYSCADGSRLTAEFTPPGAPDASAKLDFAAGGRSYTLPAAMSADGGRYADADTEFWIKGSEARLTRNGVSTDCKVH